MAGRPKKPKVYGWPAKWLAPGKWYTVIIPQSEAVFAEEGATMNCKVWEGRAANLKSATLFCPELYEKLQTK